MWEKTKNEVVRRKKNNYAHKQMHMYHILLLQTFEQKILGFSWKMLWNWWMRFSCSNMEQCSNLIIASQLRIHKIFLEDCTCIAPSSVHLIYLWVYLLILLAPRRLSCSHFNHRATYTPYISWAEKMCLGIVKNINHKSDQTTVRFSFF